MPESLRILNTLTREKLQNAAEPAKSVE